jgi:hypothetical protein
MNVNLFLRRSKVLRQARKLGVEQEGLMDIFDEVLAYIGQEETE